MVKRLAELPAQPRVIDPACGDGVFLRQALDCGLATCDRLFGCDIEPHFAESWRAGGLCRVYGADGLADHPDLGITAGSFDLVVGNPPFGFAGRGRPRMEIAFLRRFVDLAAGGGQIAVILPEGIFANARTQRLRDGLLDGIRVHAIIELPGRAFAHENTAARTAVLFAQRTPGQPSDTVRLGRIPDDWAGDPDRAVAESIAIPTERLRGERWDPHWWLWPGRECLDQCPWPVRPLGDFIEHLTYGPVLPGRRPEPVAAGVVVINQKQLRPTGLDLSDAVCVAPGSAFDPPRCRVQAGDILMARCGAGSLPQAKLAIVEGDFAGTVSCFVDIVRVRGMEPSYVAAFLKSRYGRGQIGRALNGVGTPNISFGEIRALRIAVPSREVQAAVARRWRQMARAHRAGHYAAAARLLEEAIGLVEGGIAAVPAAVAKEIA